MKSSILSKILLTLFLILIVASIVFLFYAYSNDKKFIDKSSRQIYLSRINLIIKTLEYKNNRLKATAMVSAYKENFQKSALDIIRETYYEKDVKSYPIILDSSGNILLHPDSVINKSFYKNKFSNKEGVETFVDYDGEVKWFIYKYFKAWHWKIVWAVPKNIIYDMLNKRLIFNLKLLFTLSLGVIFFTWFFIKQIFKPIEELKNATVAMSKGEKITNIKVDGSDEIALLADAFNKMNNAIYNQMLLIRQREKEYKELVESSNSIILKWDKDGKIKFLNSYGLKLFGYDKSEIIGRNVMDTIVSEKESTGRDLKEMIDDILENPNKYNLNINENICKNGEIVWIQWSNKALLDDEGNFLEMLSIGIDVTELKQLEAELKQSQKMEVIGTLAGGIAHDFNNILTAIFGYIDIIKLKSDNSKIIEYIDEINEASLRAKELVEQILIYSRKTEQKQSLINLEHTVENVLKLIRSSFPATIDIKKYIESDLKIIANETQIHQLLMNMCTNALHAMEDKGGILKIFAFKEIVNSSEIPKGEYIHIVIQDTGCGIDVNHLNKIFDPYFTTKEAGKGTGMGLAVVSGIVANLNGFIKVESELHEGTKFDVYLPVYNNDIEWSENDKKDFINNFEGSGNIVVVDDEQFILDVVSELLCEFGYEINTFLDAHSALSFIANNRDKCDLLLTDLTMPVMTGEELVKIVNKKFPDIKVIMCSGYKDRLKEENLKELNIEVFMQKPLDFMELIESIDTIMVKNN